jgi:hypothetical protein
MPAYDFVRIEQRVIDAPTADVYKVMRDLDCLMIHSPITDLAVFVRHLPSRLVPAEPGQVSKTPPMPRFRLSALFEERSPEQERAIGAWVGIAEQPGRSLVFGAVGKPWKARVEWRSVQPGEVATFSEPGWAKIIASLSVQGLDDRRSLLIYEARSTATDTDSRERFHRYWLAISPFVAAIMRAMLRAVEEQMTEESATDPSTA